MKYLVAIMVPEPGRAALLALQHAHRPAGWRIRLDPHITLLPPSKSLMGPEEAIEAFRQLAPEIGLEITATRLGQFSDGRNGAVYLEAQPLGPLQELSLMLHQTATWQAVRPPDWPQFTPHITLANHVAPGEREQLADTLGKKVQTVEFHVNRATLLGKEPHWAAWRILA